MIGSPNPGYFVYDDDPALEKIFQECYTGLGIPTEIRTEGDGRSDHAVQSAGIRSAGCSAVRTTRRRRRRRRSGAGRRGKRFDPCYHSSCDTTSNVNTTALDRNADAIAYALWGLATQ
ncbi:M28 family peptidase [Streptomyces sp. KL116D]|uniref:M28 family peptidase n=1 Tax=Streptomyces sp. KL116D TaxID=3045152 RepID=UPI0035589550